MRIDCEQCGAAFSIDDALISERGVRAQCPKCGHQKVVKKPAPAPSPLAGAPAPVTAVHNAPPPTAANPFAPPAASNPFAPPAASNPFAAPSQPPQAASPFGAAPGANPFAAPTTPGPSANPFAAPTAPSANPFAPPTSAPSPNPFGAPSANPFAPPSTAPGKDPFANMGGDPFSAAPAAPPPKPAARDPFFGNDGARPPMSAAPGAITAANAPVAVPPRPADDPFGAKPSPAFDQPQFGRPGEKIGAPDPFDDPSRTNTATVGNAGPGGGAVDDPFAKLDLGGPAPPRLAETSGPPQHWRVRTKAGMDAEVDLPSLREMIRSGKVAPEDEAGPLGEALKPVRQQPLLLVSQKKEPAIPRPAGARARSAPSFGRVAALVAVLVLVGGAIGLRIAKPELFASKQDTGGNPLKRAKSAWEKQFPDVGGTAQEHIAAGRAQMRLDTAAGYRKADDEFRQALLLDMGNVQAIAAWVENLANLPAVRADLEGTNLANEAIAYALRKEPESPEALRAQGALKLALGDVDLAQKTLEHAKSRKPDDLQTLLVLAKSHVDRDPQDALGFIQQVRTKDPDLKYALVVEGAAQRRLGAFKEARAVLRQRLESDPNNTGALKELARLELDVGNPEQAIKALTELIQAEERDVDAHLMRAKIAYQVLRTPDAYTKADEYLTEVLTKHDTTAGDLLLPALAHAAYVKAELGQLDDALKLAERGRAIDPSYAPVLFVLARVQSLRGQHAEGAKILENAVRVVQAREPFYEPIVRGELARIQGLAGDGVNAVRNFEQVIEYDPRYTRAHFALGALYMSTDKAIQALTIMRRAIANDPAHEFERVVLTDYPTPRRDLIPMAEAFAKAKAPPDDPSLAAQKLAAEGMIRWHAGQLKEAEQLQRKVLAEDRFNHLALLYLGIIELNDGRIADAKKHLLLAADTTGKGHAITRLYLARAEMKTGEIEVARRRLQDVIDQEPTLVQAQYSLGMVLREQKLEAQAREELRKVVKTDQDFTPAKRALAEGL